METERILKRAREDGRLNKEEVEVDRNRIQMYQRERTNELGKCLDVKDGKRDAKDDIHISHFSKSL